MADILTLSPAGTQKFNVDDSGNVTIAGTAAVTGALTVAGVTSSSTLDLNAGLDLDHALTAAGDLGNITGTINHATAIAEGLDISIAQLTTARSAGTVAALKVATTSLAGDSGGTYAGIYLSHTDGGGSAVHTGIYGDTALDAFAIASASGKMGFTVGAMTAKSPETDAEAGFITIRVGSTAYEIPFYAVA